MARGSMIDWGLTWLAGQEKGKDHTISIEEPPAASQNATGEKIVSGTWTTIASGLAARVTRTGSKETWHGNQVQMQSTYRVRIDYRAGLTTKMRVDYGGLKLNIDGIIGEPAADRETILLCTEAG